MDVFPSGTEHLLTCAEMARADAYAVEHGVPGTTLMAHAGAAVATAIRRRYRPRPVLVLAGPGNNGGDGWVVARDLADHGWEVRIASLGDPAALKGDAAWARSLWNGPVESIHPHTLDGAGIVVDALFGAGLTRAVDGVAAEALRALADRVEAGSAVSVAVDVPSGVDGNTGVVRGVAARADLTVTFFRRKPGHLLLPGRALCGTVRVADIGIPEAVLGRIRPSTAVNGPAVWRAALGERLSSDHKYRRGHVVVVGGPMSGAARLAVGAARRAGVGLATAAVPHGATALFAGDSPGVIVREADGPQALARLLTDKRYSGIVIGPGLGGGDRPHALTAVALHAKRPLVLDADGLNTFDGRVGDLAASIAAPTVLTPHEGEFRRLFPAVHPSVAGKLAAARLSAHETGAVTLLKGADTVIASPDGRSVIVENAPPTLATAGSGDVLAGLIGGLLARGVPAFEAAAAGAWIHGEAARAAGSSVLAEDLVARIGPIAEAL
ncbi:bifunctional NAD(P)H-hydrate repair enzyme [Thalassobaculum fulvum]|uniref:Bifunctional NAD(P)H-hydrate repair enzyme n=1 Tax=Thalassobaculum fulvum TaxID=1633335 RepID=A0A918XQG6_9PROT|nr:NAD(P)H-hydrate dehydratase [Thalassobaculum fulvum]GHD47234.1 bifunctional NAD(P)H-hydrate repair enzyme [Thalassobaculum fulvum]